MISPSPATRPLLRVLTALTVLVVLLLPAVTQPPVVQAAGTDYYVSRSGSDNANGTAANRAWRSSDRVNDQTFKPGDRILFEGGQTFRGGLYFDGSERGTPDQPITISSYGTGRATLNAGRETAIFVEAAGGYVISNLNIVGSGRESNGGDGISLFNDLPRNRKLDYVRIDNIDVGGFGN